MKKTSAFLLSLLAVLTATILFAAGGEGTDFVLPTDSGSSWKAHWNEKRLSAFSTRYISINENGKQVVMARSRDAASALYRPMMKPLAEQMDLTWQWRVTRSLVGNSAERDKAGDDYAARVLVSFSPKLFDKKSRALCYVWASTEAEGAVYRSPYTNNVAMIVLKSGTRELGQWVTETRDIVEDYRQAFGTSPDTLYAVAVMVDTDNTNSRATAWFSDIQLKTPPSPSEPSF
jgi:hypothetical protein